jgi:hypothetical protein
MQKNQWIVTFEIKNKFHLSNFEEKAIKIGSFSYTLMY